MTVLVIQLANYSINEKPTPLQHCAIMYTLWSYLCILYTFIVGHTPTSTHNAYSLWRTRPRIILIAHKSIYAKLNGSRFWHCTELGVGHILHIYMEKLSSPAARVRSIRACLHIWRALDNISIKLIEVYIERW